MRILPIVVASLCVAACHSGGSGGSSDPDGDRDGFAASMDCNDAEAAAWRTLTAFTDSDRDGIGAGPSVSTCAGAATPAGFALTSTDCAPNDAAAHTLTAYAARDADGDGVLVASAGSVCSNGTTLPAGYFAAAGATGDCDDGNASGWQIDELYEDFDRDTVGHGPLLDVCVGNAVPPGYAGIGTDCAPLDASKWRMAATYSDIDGDGVGSGAFQPQCVGSAPPPGSSFLGFDPLDTSDPSSALVSDFDLNFPSLIVEQDVGDPDTF